MELLTQGFTPQIISKAGSPQNEPKIGIRCFVKYNAMYLAQHSSINLVESDQITHRECPCGSMHTTDINILI
jgi:hypothetical protein